MSGEVDIDDGEVEMIIIRDVWGGMGGWEADHVNFLSSDH